MLLRAGLTAGVVAVVVVSGRTGLCAVGRDRALESDGAHVAHSAKRRLDRTWKAFFTIGDISAVADKPGGACLWQSRVQTEVARFAFEAAVRTSGAIRPNWAYQAGHSSARAVCPGKAGHGGQLRLSARKTGRAGIAGQAACQVGVRAGRASSAHFVAPWGKRTRGTTFGDGGRLTAKVTSRAKLAVQIHLRTVGARVVRKAVTCVVVSQTRIARRTVLAGAVSVTEVPDDNYGAQQRSNELQ
jgi:hypothetical protein